MNCIIAAFMFAYLSLCVLAGIWVSDSRIESRSEEPIGYCEYIWYYPDGEIVAVKMDQGKTYKETVKLNGLHHDLGECK